MKANNKITPFRIDIPQTDVDDLRYRIGHMRWPSDIDNESWQYGFNREYLHALSQYWAESYDWRKAEAEINRFPQFIANVDGIKIHFIHVRGSGNNPTPLILHHGWPSTFWDMHQLIEPLTQPEQFGGNAEESFDVIIPSLPGFGFSTPLKKPCSPQLAADTLHTLMTEILGYSRYAASGGDLGSRVTLQMGHKYAEHLIGIHTLGATPIDMFSNERFWDITASFIPYDAPKAIRKAILPTLTHVVSHACVQSIEPQTLSYAMNDSPVGQLAWILQRWRDWGQTAGNLESVFDRDFLLTTASIYWFGESFGSSARYYRNQVLHPWQASHPRSPRIEAPTGISFMGGECPPGLSLEQWLAHFKQSPAAKDYNLVYCNVHKKGGHFGYVENPEACINDLRSLFSKATLAGYRR